MAQAPEAPPRDLRGAGVREFSKAHQEYAVGDRVCPVHAGATPSTRPRPSHSVPGCTGAGALRVAVRPGRRGEPPSSPPAGSGGIGALLTPPRCAGTVMTAQKAGIDPQFTSTTFFLIPSSQVMASP